MRREAFKMFLNPGQKEEYKRRHANLFPELRRLLSESGVRNYSIYLDEDTNTLYAYQELEGDGGSRQLARQHPAARDVPHGLIVITIFSITYFFYHVFFYHELAN